MRKDLFADVNTVGSRYIAVGHLNIEQKQVEQSHSSDETMSHLKTFRTSPLQVSHGVSFLGHDDVTKWKHFPRYWPFVRGIHRSPENSPHKGQWRRALIFSLICVWINVWVNNREAGDLRRYRVHYDVTVMCLEKTDHEIWRERWYTA